MRYETTKELEELKIAIDKLIDANGVKEKDILLCTIRCGVHVRAGRGCVFYTNCPVPKSDGCFRTSEEINKSLVPYKILKKQLKKESNW